MFGIGGWEFVLIVVLALLLFGPDKLPQFARTVGRFMREMKRYQDLMDATIRAEMFNADPSLRKDAFEMAKEARKRTGAGGGFTPVEPSEAEEPEAPEASESEDAGQPEGEAAGANEPAEGPVGEPEAAPEVEGPAVEPEAAAEAEPTALDESDTGEGEQGKE